ncbi:MAG TPA: hypothetical protein DCY13_04805 [Verrucomicrobiales bacterium]|nr:hypothetical protein [Verrucomicrobiales bacterium]
MILSEHTRHHTSDEPSRLFSISQAVGCGPKEDNSRFVRIPADNNLLRTVVENIGRQEASSVSR